MDHEGMQEAAKAAFRAHVPGMEVLGTSAHDREDRHGEPYVEIRLVYDGPRDALDTKETAMAMHAVRQEVIDTLWMHAEGEQPWPHLQLIAKADLRRGEDPTAG